MKIFFVTLLTLTGCLGWTFDHSHNLWKKVLESFQDAQGKMNYKGLKSEISKNPDQHTLNEYLKALSLVEEKEFKLWTVDQRKAFLINAYNALTVKLIIDHYPVSSIKKIGGFFSSPWKLEFFSLMGGKIKSLDPIEHKWLRPEFKDFRIHAAVNCASISCPRLRHEAYVPEKIEAQLNNQMEIWLGDAGRNEISTEGIKLSKIFDWYKEDFARWGEGIPAVLKKYAKVPDLAKINFVKTKIEFLDYNWDLNEAL